MATYKTLKEVRAEHNQFWVLINGKWQQLWLSNNENVMNDRFKDYYWETRLYDDCPAVEIIPPLGE
jgi:hypothetical protein